MAQFFTPQNTYGSPPASAGPNLQFYQSQYNSGVSGHSTPAQGYGGFGGMGSMGSMGSIGTTPGMTSAGGVERGGLTMGWLAAFGTSGYDDEPPLLEELGVNFGHIKTKTLAVLNPLRTVEQHMMDDSDVAGPIIFCLLFGTNLLLSGKVHFGYIYGVALLGSVSLHVLFNLMSPPTHSLSYIRSASMLGYCLLPLVFTSSLGIVMPLDGMVGYSATAAAIVWSTYAASNMFVAALGVREMRWLVAYPLALFYSVFGIMSIFGSKASEIGGAGKLGKP